MTIIKGKAYFDMPDYKDITDLLAQSVEKYGHEYAITYRNNPKEEPIHVTYKELQADAEALYQAWGARGLVSHKAAIVGVNSYQWILSYFAAAKSQEFIIPMDNLLTEKELIPLLVRSEADILCIDLAALMKLVDLEDYSFLKQIRLIQVMNVKKVNNKAIETFHHLKGLFHEKNPDVEIIYLEDLLDHGYGLIKYGEIQTFKSIPEDVPSVLIFTSGTTDEAKGVLLSQKSLVHDVSLLHGIIDFPKRLRSLSMLPLNHTFESTCGMLGALSIGGHVHINDGLRYVQKNLQEYQIGMFIGVPAIFDSFYKRIMQQVKKEGKEKTLAFGLKLTKFLRKIGLDIRRKMFKDILAGIGNLEIGIIGAAPMRAEQIEFFDAIGIRVYEGYGLTETSPVAIANNDFIFEPGTIGQPLPGIEACVDSAMPGEPGELMLRGPIVMSGYYKNEAATKEVLSEDGWFRTGDLATFDPKTHCFKITGRLKSMIVLDSGKKIFPEEIEDIIKAKGYDLIKDMMVFGQRANNNQILLSIKFIINKLDEKMPSEEELINFLDNLVAEINDRLPDFKRIKTYFYSYKDMISTSTLKVKRDEERKRIERMKEKLNLTWNDISRKNIDELEAKLPQL